MYKNKISHKNEFNITNNQITYVQSVEYPQLAWIYQRKTGTYAQDNSQHTASWYFRQLTVKVMIFGQLPYCLLRVLLIGHLKQTCSPFRSLCVPIEIPYLGMTVTCKTWNHCLRTGSFTFYLASTKTNSVDFRFNNGGGRVTVWVGKTFKQVNWCVNINYIVFLNIYLQFRY